MAVERLTPTRRRELTRRNLLEAAAVVFAREGFHGASLDEVAAAAGFTKGAVYSNFKSKEDLFLELLEDRMEQSLVAAEAAREADVEQGGEYENIRTVMTSQRAWDATWTALYLEFVLYATRNPAARVRLAESVRRGHQEAMRMIQAELDLRGATLGVPLAEVANISLAVFEGLTLSHLIEPALISPQTIDVALKFLAAAERGLETDAAPESA